MENTMTESEKKKCHAIIHSHALLCAAGNAVPVPGAGVAADTATMTSMCMALAAVFGGSITAEVAKGMAVTAIKRQISKNLGKVIVKEVCKLVPFFGQIVSPTLSIVIIEAAGWSMAQQLAEEKRSRDLLREVPASPEMFPPHESLGALHRPAEAEESPRQNCIRGKIVQHKKYV
jgi:uncharacterized protein (DUF697 family)